jgi:predicted MFS family arabinose efflux permease
MSNAGVLRYCAQNLSGREIAMSYIRGIRPLTAAMAFGQVGNLLPHVVVPAIMPQHLMPLWGLSAAEAGLMASAYAFGYLFAVPVLAALTDRIDARTILVIGSALSGLATIAFGLLATGLLSASLLWGLAGIGFAGAYMPGLKALTDRLPAGDTSRSVTLYTSSYSVGVGLSFLVSQLVAEHIGWRAAFILTGLGPLVMIAACLLLEPFPPKPKTGRLLDFRAVLRNRPALGYILGYGAHCFELYGLRTWIVAFWTFVAARDPEAIIGPIVVSVLVTLLSFPSSIFGNEAARRFGRHRAITAFMFLSAVCAALIGLLSSVSPFLLLVLVLFYGIAASADSGALTSGTTASAVAEHRGATLALHSTVGFGLSAAGAWTTGVVIDAAGGTASASGWLAAFSLLGLGALTGPVALWWARKHHAKEGTE